MPLRLKMAPSIVYKIESSLTDVGEKILKMKIDIRMFSNIISFYCWSKEPKHYISHNG